LQERAWVISGTAQAAQSLITLLKQKPALLGSHQASGFRSNMTRPQYETAIQKTIEDILAGDIFQANITQRFETDCPHDFDAFAFYNTLRAKNPATFASLLVFDDVTLISSSPERLIKCDGNLAEARPIKGTRKRDSDPARDAELVGELQASRKDRAENVMIVDLLRNDISRVAKPGTVRVPNLCGLETYANVHHLVSAVTGELRDGLDQVDLFEAVFPGGSITGAPKIRAMEIIADREKLPRGAYCGAIGYFGYNGQSDFNIAIRTVQMAHGKLSLAGGGGITARSEPAAEYDESLLKIARIMEAFA
jgi:para-aminobenzoate synthetase component I